MRQRGRHLDAIAEHGALPADRWALNAHARSDDQAYYDATANKVVFHLGNGASGAAGGSLPSTATQSAGTTVEYRVTIDRASGGKQITNTATASYENRLGDRPESLTSTCNEQVTQVKPAADLTVTKAVDATTVTVGQTVTYRITVHNTGPNGATGVTVTDPLSDSLTFLSADGTSGGYDPATGRWAVGELDDGATATLVLRAKATEVGLISNTAIATGKRVRLLGRGRGPGRSVRGSVEEAT
ncbi:DUF11 domain-containing protein [Streptomyces sp. NPDC048521]|uniref:DUF11 domain-containing protein n=1 Tax=Streptomyces sp. NPDC048521 TaxID=3365566 RepID=UPI00371CC474